MAKQPELLNHANAKPIQMTFPAREVRRVPLNWVHPIDENGRHILLMDRRDLVGFEEFLDPGEELTPEYIEASFMPDFSGLPGDEMGVIVYHRDGVPMDSAQIFPDTSEGHKALLRHTEENISAYGTDNFLTAEAWDHMLFIGDVFGMDMETGILIPAINHQPS